MNTPKLSILIFSSVFILSACSTFSTPKGIGQNIATALILGGASSFPSEEDENKDKNSYDSDKRQSYGLVAGGLLLHYLLRDKSNSKPTKGRPSDNLYIESKSPDNFLEMPIEGPKKGNLIYKSSKYGGEIRNYKGNILFYTTEHNYENDNRGSLFQDSDLDIMLHEAKLEKMKYYAEQQEKQIYTDVANAQLNIIKSVKRQKFIQSPWIVTPVFIGGVLAIASSNTKGTPIESKLPKSTSRKTSPVKQTKKVNQKKKAITKGVKDIKVVGKQFGKFTLYRVFCNNGKSEGNFYQNSKGKWWKTSPINMSYGYTKRSINQIANTICN